MTQRGLGSLVVPPWCLAICVFVCLSSPTQVGAHPAPAEPPAFSQAPCMQVVELAATAQFDLRYDVPVSDTVLDPDLLALPDTKTHEFFAFAARVFDGASETTWASFGDPTGQTRPLPLWVSEDDLARARVAAVDHEVAREVLETAGPSIELDETLRDRVLPFGSTPHRLPITTEQGIFGVRWALADAPPGVYQLVAHTFSPPYNAWTPRPGLVRLVRDGAGPPAVWLDEVGARLFAGQGRPVTGCVSAPVGSRLQLEVQPEADPAAAFELASDDVAVEADGRFETCLVNPGIDGAWRVRATLTTPDGEVGYAFGGELLELMAAKASCVPTELRCCPDAAEPPAEAPGGLVQAPPVVPAGRENPAGLPVAPTAGEGGPAGEGGRGSAEGPLPGPVDLGQAGSEATGGCSLVAVGQQGRFWPTVSVLPIAFLLGARRHQRRS